MSDDSPASPPHDILERISQLLKEQQGSSDKYCLVGAEAAKSAQHEVYILKFEQDSDSCTSNGRPQPPAAQIDPKSQHNCWKKALHSGNNRLVLRIWKGGSTWWNLHQNASNSIAKLAQQEVMGYRIA